MKGGEEVLSRTGFQCRRKEGFDGVRNVYDTTPGLVQQRRSVIPDFERDQEGFFFFLKKKYV